MPRIHFNRIRHALFLLLFFQRKTDAIGKPDIHPLQKIADALRMFSTRLVDDAIDEYVHMSAPLALSSLKENTKVFVDIFEDEYL